MPNAMRRQSARAIESLASAHTLEAHATKDHRELGRVDAHALLAASCRNDLESPLLQPLVPEHEAVAVRTLELPRDTKFVPQLSQSH